MYKIDNESAVETMPTPAAVGVNPDGFFRSGTNHSLLPTQLDADWLNAIQNEISNVIDGANIDLDKTDRTQFYAAMQYLVNTGIPPVVISSPLSANLSLFQIVSSNNQITFIPHTTADFVDFQSGILRDGSIIQRKTEATNFFSLTAALIRFTAASASKSVFVSASGLSVALASGGLSVNSILDEDAFTSNSAVKTFTQQSFKAYCDNRRLYPRTIYMYAFCENITDNTTAQNFYLGRHSSGLTSSYTVPTLFNTTDYRYDLKEIIFSSAVAPGSSKTFTVTGYNGTNTLNAVITGASSYTATQTGTMPLDPFGTPLTAIGLYFQKQSGANTPGKIMVRLKFVKR